MAPKYMDDDVAEYHLAPCPCGHRSTVTYTNVPYSSTLHPDDPDLIPVDVFCTKDGLSVCGHATPPPIIATHPNPSNTLSSVFSRLPQSLKTICGSVHFPPDDGIQLLQGCQANGNHLFCASNASYRNGRATHAWLVSTRKATDLEHPNLTIRGGGHVDGYSPHMSSSRGELHSLTALSIMTDLFCHHSQFNGTITAICDNQGIIKKCDTPKSMSLHRQRDPNINLLLNKQFYRKKNHLKLEWVRSHTDKEPWTTVDDLLLQKLSRDEIFNVWVHKLAKHVVQWLIWLP